MDDEKDHERDDEKDDDSSLTHHWWGWGQWGEVQVADGDAEQQSWINVAVNSYLQD